MKILKLNPVQIVSIAAAMTAVVASFGPAFAQSAAPAASGTPAADAASPATDPNAAAAGVYNWQDVPTNQRVVIDRAVFDQGGYQLYCHTGETIVVPFVNNNLFVMKFGRSDGEEMYFVNDGGATPSLYIPQGGYLENAAANGARWYPFPPIYTYTIPVYLGIAPGWDDYCDMGWYPGMAVYGGYWGHYAYQVGIAFGPTPGLYISISGRPYYGWSEYHAYYIGNPADRFNLHAVPVYHYDRFPPRGPAYYGQHWPFASSRPGGSGVVVHNVGDANFAGRPNPAFSHGGAAGGQLIAVNQPVAAAHAGTVSAFGNPKFSHSTAATLASDNRRAADSAKPIAVANPRFVGYSLPASPAGPGAAMHGAFPKLVSHSEVRTPSRTHIHLPKALPHAASSLVSSAFQSWLNRGQSDPGDPKQKKPSAEHTPQNSTAGGKK